MLVQLCRIRPFYTAIRMGRNNQSGTDTGSSAILRHTNNLTQTMSDRLGQARQQPDNAIQVDSWRSYKNDASSSLQVTINGDPQLNPTAASFTPGNMSQLPSRSQHMSRQPLRSSKNVNPRKTLNSNWRALHVDTKRQEQDSTESDPELQSSVAEKVTDRPVQSVESSNDESKNTMLSANNSLPVPNLRSQARTKSRTPPSSRSITPPPAPLVSYAYRKQASLPPTAISSNDSPQKLLIILDLNGTLLYRPSRRGAPTKIQARPGVTPFLDYLFQNHVVMIYTSAKPENAVGMVNNLIHPQQRRKMAAVWARDKLDLTQTQYHNKVQVYKKLDKVWADTDVQATVPGGVEKWDQRNTILIDDSRLKGLAQPHNLLQVPEYTKTDMPQDPKKRERAVKIQTEIMKQLEMKLEELKWQNDVSQMIRCWQAGEKSVPRVEGQEISVDETTDVKDMAQSGEQDDNEENSGTQQNDPVLSKIRHDRDIDTEAKEFQSFQKDDNGRDQSKDTSSQDSKTQFMHDQSVLEITDRISGLGHSDNSSSPPTNTQRNKG